MVLYMIGGLTYGEVASLEKVAKKNGINLIICATEVLNCKRMVDAFKDDSGVDEKS